MHRRSLAQALLAALALSACATVAPRPTTINSPPSASPPAASPASIQPPAPLAPLPAPPVLPTLAALPGWAQEDHAGALAAFAAGCGAGRDLALAVVCRAARALGPVGEEQARAFLERSFTPEPIATPGLLTAYFTPIYEARRARGGEFTAPVRPPPADLPRGDDPAPYPERAEIERRPARDALAWMRPEDLFFLQIQGSGLLAYPDGPQVKAVFAGSNGAPFRGVAAVLRGQGQLADDDTSGEAIHAWLAAHRGAQAEAVMREDPRYVFFRLAANDGAMPVGAAGVPLIPGRSLAVDPASQALGELLWIDAAAPALTGAFPSYRRLALALDTGGAIKGAARADLYLGVGPGAGLEAGRVRHVLRLYRLAPVLPAGS